MEEAKNKVISTGLGDFSKVKFSALIEVRSVALTGLRHALASRDYTEVSMASLVNVAGSCENPHASFTLPYYGREAHLSQSAQLQLEALVMRLKGGFYTVNNSYREESYDDPEAQGRRLSEFTLIEPEKPYLDCSPDEALNRIIAEQEEVIKYATNKIIQNVPNDIYILSGDATYLAKVVKEKFNRISYDTAIDLLNKIGDKQYRFGDDLGILEERRILEHFDNIPTFVTHFPTSLKFFNMKRMEDGERVYSVDLLMPRLGETTGGAVREEDGDKIKEYFLTSKVAEYAKAKGLDPIVPFTEYFNLFDQEEPMLRGGYGIGFERFIGFLLSSNDILETIAYRTMQP